MRYELSDYEWGTIRPLLPNKPHGDDRRILNGIFWIFAIRRAMARSTSELWPLHDLLQSLRSLAKGWRLDQILDALTIAHDATVQMIDTSIVRVHQHGACVAGKQARSQFSRLHPVASIRLWVRANESTP